MPFRLVSAFLPFLLVHLGADAPASGDFIYEGFKSSNLSLDGLAEVTASGILQITNNTHVKVGHAFHPNPINFKSKPNSSAFSFSTQFVFAIVPDSSGLSADGMAFVIAPTIGLPGGDANEFLGIFNETNDKSPANHVFAVELDTIQNPQFDDVNNNHVGIDINSLKSSVSEPARYHANNGNSSHNLSLGSGKLMQLWVEYDAENKRINVTLAPTAAAKPNTPLLSLSDDLSPILQQNMFVGFSASTGPVQAGTHVVLGWSFKINGDAQALVLSRLPKLPRFGPKKVPKLFTKGFPIICTFLLLLLISGIAYHLWRKWKFAEVLEEWERAYGPHRFKYQHLYIATNGFREKELLGAGGFGRVYKGVLPTNKIEVAVKKVTHQSGQGMREFVAEIVSIGRLRHRNLVPLLGYCRRKGELLLVYQFMHNCSLDRFLYDQPKSTLSWRQRFRVIEGVASGLFYLHEEWEQVVIHRDIKASNVLLDAEWNGKLGDFGLARLYDHGTLPQTTRIAGTIGYIAPELNRTGKATTSSDVYAFGAFLLEVACGRRPIEPQATIEELILVDWVFSCWKAGVILQAVDPKLGTEFVMEEAKLILKLGLLCSHSEPMIRPSMRQVLMYLKRSVPLPKLSSMGISSIGLGFNQTRYSGFDDKNLPLSSSANKSLSGSGVESVLSDGR